MLLHIKMMIAIQYWQVAFVNIECWILQGYDDDDNDAHLQIVVKNDFVQGHLCINAKWDQN